MCAQDHISRKRLSIRTRFEGARAVREDATRARRLARSTAALAGEPRHRRDVAPAPESHRRDPRSKVYAGDCANPLHAERTTDSHPVSFVENHVPGKPRTFVV